MNKIWRFISSVIFILTAIIAAFELYRCGVSAVKSCTNSMYAGFLWLGVGMVSYIIIEKIFFRKNIDILQTMSHEGAHMIIGGLFLRRKIYEFNAKSTDSLGYGDNTLGFVKSDGYKINIFSMLAPYMFPYITFILLFFRLMIKNECLPIIDVVIGFSLMFYFGCWKKDTRRDQSDLQACGVFRSFLFIITFVLFDLAIILYSVSGGTKEPVNIIQANADYFTQAWNDIIMLVNQVKIWIG